MNAAQIARALGGGSRNGDGWITHCPGPVHGRGRGDKNASLSIRDGENGNILSYCFAGCDQASVKAALQSRGLLSHGDHYHSPTVRQRSHDNLIGRENTKRSERALRLWEAAVPISGTLADTYLQSRGISILLPGTLRFHAGLKHPTAMFPPTPLNSPSERIVKRT